MANETAGKNLSVMGNGETKSDVGSVYVDSNSLLTSSVYQSAFIESGDALINLWRKHGN
jgi:hypothetical protein